MLLARLMLKALLIYLNDALNEGDILVLLPILGGGLSERENRILIPESKGALKKTISHKLRTT